MALARQLRTWDKHILWGDAALSTVEKAPPYQLGRDRAKRLGLAVDNHWAFAAKLKSYWREVVRCSFGNNPANTLASSENDVIPPLLEKSTHYWCAA